MDPNWQLARKRPILENRARIVQAIRAFFIELGFLEVETPMRIPANAPESHIDAVSTGDWFLQTSPELAMKRLLAAGYEKIFQVSHCWRAEERGRCHLPEYSMLEWYRSGCDYQSMMSDCENLLEKLVPSGNLLYQGQLIDLTLPWPRLTVKEAFRRYSHLSIEEALAKGRYEEVLCGEIEPQLPAGRPVFLYEYPAVQASLALLKNSDRSVAERFELYLGGLELANAYSELTDAAEQRQRFKQEETVRRSMGKPAYPVPEPFLQELDCISAASGIALGLDRLVMLLCDCQDIAEVVSFTPEQL